MNIDARICEYVIADFVSTGTPILTIHDSFIVPVGSEERLNEVMREAFNQVTGKDHIKVKYNQNLTKKSLYALIAQDRSFFQEMFWYMSRGHRPEAGYQQRRQRHIERCGSQQDVGMKRRRPLGSPLKNQPAFGYHQSMYRAVITLLVGLMLSLGGGASL